jgi:hypothetical protein
MRDSFALVGVSFKRSTTHPFVGLLVIVSGLFNTSHPFILIVDGKSWV